MSVTIAARAPGKLFVTGEWAVLHGAPAVVAAIDRLVHVELELGAGDGPLVVESLAENAERPLAFDAALPPGDGGAVLAAFRAATALEPSLAETEAHLRVDSRALLDGERKLGLGRSAATLAATAAALLTAAGRSDRGELLDVAVTAHARLQDGRGSGADVAAAVQGGVIEVRRRTDALEVVRRVLPPGLSLLVGYTGEPAATEPLLRRFSPAAAPATLAELCRVAERAAQAVAHGDARALADGVASSATLLERLGRETGLPLVTPALARLIAAARRLGVAAKPSGAGGGDCGIALAASSAEAEAVRAAWRAEGIVPLPLAIAAEGAVAEHRQPARRAGLHG
jgi:phosphomevalonate kinase